MSERSTALLLQDVLKSAENIIEYTSGLSYEQFISDNKTVDAVIRNFEIIGEASHRLPVAIKDQFINIDWFRLRGFRNRIVHEYFGIDYEIVWEIKNTYVPALIDELKLIIENVG